MQLIPDLSQAIIPIGKENYKYADVPRWALLPDPQRPGEYLGVEVDVIGDGGEISTYTLDDTEAAAAHAELNKIKTITDAAVNFGYEQILNALLEQQKGAAKP